MHKLLCFHRNTLGLQKCNYSITFALWRSAITFKWKKKFKLLIILVLLLVTIHSYSYTLLQQSFRCYYGLYNRVLPALTYLFHCIKGLYTVRVDGAPVTFSQSGTVYDADPIQNLPVLHSWPVVLTHDYKWLTRT